MMKRKLSLFSTYNFWFRHCTCTAIGAALTDGVVEVLYRCSVGKPVVSFDTFETEEHRPRVFGAAAWLAERRAVGGGYVQPPGGGQLKVLART